jgi:hypothetical protein
VLELQSLREIVTISQSWNYNHCNKYLQCLIVGITLRRNGDEGPADVRSSRRSTPRPMDAPYTALATDEEVHDLCLDAAPTYAHPRGP